MKSAMKFKIAVSISHRHSIASNACYTKEKSGYEIVKKKKNLFHFSYIPSKKKEKKGKKNFLSTKIRNPMMRDTCHSRRVN